MIEIKNVSKKFGDQFVLKDIDLNIADGEQVLFAGQNGAGKSSLMRIILGEFKPNSGEVRVNGFDPFTARKEALGVISFVPQTPPPLKFNLKELCEFVCKSSNVAQENIEKFCEKMELDLKGNFHKPFYKLSGGMKQKMLIAIAFAKNTEAMMFDEPTANLDPKARRNFMDLLGEFAREKTLVFISHRLDEVQGISNRYVEMDLGQIVKDELISQGGAHA